MLGLEGSAHNIWFGLILPPFPSSGNVPLSPLWSPKNYKYDAEYRGISVVLVPGNAGNWCARDLCCCYADRATATDTWQWPLASMWLFGVITNADQSPPTVTFFQTNIQSHCASIHNINLFQHLSLIWQYLLHWLVFMQPTLQHFLVVTSYVSVFL